MAQTTGALSGVANSVEISANGSAWTDISGFANKVDADSQSRMNGVAYTFDGDTGIVTFGKLEPFSIKVSILYTEGTDSPTETLRGYHQAADGTAVYMRWSPKGSGTGDFEYTTPSTKISEFNFPSVDAGSGDPIMVEITFGPVPYVTKSLATT